MLHVEPEEVVDDGDEDAQDQHSEATLGYLVRVEHHVQACGTNGQVKEVGSEEHHQDGQTCVEPQEPPSEHEPRHRAVACFLSEGVGDYVNLSF